MDVGEEATEVCILRNGHCDMARTLSVGASALREGQAEMLASALRRTLMAYRATGGLEPVEAFVSGLLVGPEATDWVSNILEVEAHALPLPPVAGADEETRARMARSTALAGRAIARGKRLDMRQGAFAPKRAMGAVRQQGRLLAISAAIVFLAFGYSTYARWSVLADERSALQAQLQSVTKDLFDQSTTDPARARQLLEGKGGRADPLPHFDAFDALDAISSRIPENVTHDTRRLTIEIDDQAHQGHFELQGTVHDQGAFETIATRIGAHDCFKNVQQGRTTPAPGGDSLNYEMQGDIACPGDGPAPGAKHGHHGSTNDGDR